MIIERRAWQWVDWALFGIITSGLGIGLLYLGNAPELGGWGVKISVISAMIACYFFFLIFWRPGYTHVTLLPVAALVSSGMLELFLTWRSGEELISATTVQLIVLGFHGKCKQLVFNIAVFVVALPTFEALYLLDTTNVFPLLISRSLNSALLLGVGYAIQKMYLSHYGMKQLYDENLRVYRLLKEQNKALEQYSNQVEKLTLVEERNRLARELHDTVGHTFTSVIMGMDAVSYLLEVAPDKARAKLDVLRQVARDGLDEVRRNIHEIAPPSEDGTFIQQIESLAREFSLHTGTQVTLKVTGAEYSLSTQAQLTLTRCLQEALTNAKRHGLAAVVEAGLEYTDRQVILTIADNGVGTEQIQAGFGLTAMRERLEALQGSLSFTSAKDQGSTLTCTVPTRSRLDRKSPKL